MDDLYVRQNDDASGQSEIMTEIRGKNQNISSCKAKSMPSSDFNIGSKSIFNELWKLSRTAFLNLLDFLSVLSLADKIGR